MGESRTDRYRISLRDGLGLYAARRGRRLQDGADAAISRLLSRPRRAKNNEELRTRSGGNAEIAPQITRIRSKPAADISCHDALSCAAACFSLELPARHAEAMISVPGQFCPKRPGCVAHQKKP